MKETFFEEVDTIYFKTMQEIQTSKYNSQVSCFTLELQTIKMNLENMPIRAFLHSLCLLLFFTEMVFVSLDKEAKYMGHQCGYTA